MISLAMDFAVIAESSSSSSFTDNRITTKTKSANICSAVTVTEPKPKKCSSLSNPWRIKTEFFKPREQF